jgi:hypothetical protein
MEDYISKWLHYPWLLGSSDIDLIHPDDREINGLGIAKCIGVEEEYLVLKTKHLSIMVKPEGVKRVLPIPKFEWDEKVIDISNPTIVATVDDFFWHFKDNVFKYFIIVNNKRKSRQYIEEELGIFSSIDT